MDINLQPQAFHWQSLKLRSFYWSWEIVLLKIKFFLFFPEKYKKIKLKQLVVLLHRPPTTRSLQAKSEIKAIVVATNCIDKRSHSQLVQFIY